MIRLAFESVADTAIIPLQDILGLDSRARMNLPGKADGNWRWRFQKDQIEVSAREHLAELTAVYSRWNGPIPPGLDPRFRPSKQDRVTAADPLLTKTTHTGP
jgi:4-alpha-glucanotransferase